MSVHMPSDSSLNPPRPLLVSEALPSSPALIPEPPSRPPPTTRYSWRNIHPQAKLHYIRSVEQANTQIELLQGPVGFDLEWRPSFRKGEPEHPVSLVQLANNETILLIQISAMEEFPNKLQEFLESPDFVKAGVAIQNDVQKLYKDHQVSTRNCVDLSLLARSVDNARWKGKYSSSVGLARLVDVYEDLLLSKGKITRTNWEAGLSPEQQEYAGNDAHSGYIVYKKLIMMSKLMATSPKAVYYTFDAVRGRLCEPSGMHWSAFNPDYDPGPPPPPKIPKPPRAQDIVPVGIPITSLVASTSSLPQIASGPSNNASKRRNFSFQAELKNPRQNGYPSGYPNSRPRFNPPPNQGSSGSNFVSSSITDAPQTTHLSDPTKLTLTGLEQSTKCSPRSRRRRRRAPNPKPAPESGAID